MIIHANGPGVNRVLDAGDTDGVNRIGQHHALGAEVVIIIFDIDRPVRRERPFSADARA